MKKLFTILPILFLILSCQKDDDPKQAVADNEISANAILKFNSTFEPTNGIMVAGGAKIYQEGNQFKVKLDNFSISEGPDLKVYLSKGATPTEFVNLGNLTTETVYVIPASVSISNYSHVLIHCQEFNHLYAIAELIPN